MKNIFKITITTLLLTALTACDLDRYPTSAVPEKEAMTTPDEAQQVVFGTYASLKNSALFSGTLTLLPDIQADFMYAVEGYRNIYGEAYRWIAKSTDTDITNVYSGLYQIISRCNFFTDNIGALEEKYTDEADAEQLSKCKGDIYFLRAYAYSELIRLYANAYDPATAETELGVSIVTTYAKNSKKPLRSNLKDSYQQVIDDLTVAEELVEREGSSPYVTKGAVQALFARVYLYMQEWEKAKEYATELISSSTYSLQDVNANTNGTQYDDYNYMWTYDEGPEVIFFVSMSYTDRGGALGVPFLGQQVPMGIFEPDYIPAQWVLDLYEDGDMRYRAFFTSIRTNYPHGLEWPLLTKYGGNPSISNNGPNLLTNMPKLLRLSEVHLIRAEACYRLGGGDNEKIANSDLTRIRQARMSSYGSSSASGDDLFKEIQKERVRELYMEGFRLADLKRWGMGFQRQEQANTVDGPNRLRVDKSNPLFTWPIPKHEMDAVEGMQPNASNN